MAVMIDDDVFIDMLWNRVDEFCPNSYSEEFWDAAFDYFKEVGWMRDTTQNMPSIIVDNIYVNGEIKTLEEIRSGYSYPDMDKKTDEELEEYLLSTEWIKIGDRYVRNRGL